MGMTVSINNYVELSNGDRVRFGYDSNYPNESRLTLEQMKDSGEIEDQFDLKNLTPDDIKELHDFFSWLYKMSH